MAKAGGARMILQKNFTPVELAKQMQKLGWSRRARPRRRARQGVGRPDATKHLADLSKRWAAIRRRAGRASSTALSPCRRCYAELPARPGSGLCNGRPMKGVGTDIARSTSSAIAASACRASPR
jgi:hypothetical protein